MSISAATATAIATTGAGAGLVGRDRALHHKWLPSDYFPIECSICGRRPLNVLVEEMREQYINSQDDDLTTKTSPWTFNGVWQDPRFELDSVCCRKQIADFEPLDIHIRNYNRANAELPPDFSMDEFVQISSTKTGRAVPTTYHPTNRN